MADPTPPPAPIVPAFTALHELIRRLFTTAMGYTDTNFFRPSGQRAPAGGFSSPYATVRLYNAETLSFNLLHLTPDDARVAALVPDADALADLIEVVDGLDSVVASVQFWKDGSVDGAGRAKWGDAALSRASSLVKRLELSSIVELANSYGLAYSTASQVRDLSAVVDGSFEGRAQVDLTFSFANPELLAIGMFRTATIDSIQIQQPSGSIDEVRA